jgi:thimet oligopeptidase
VGEDDMTPPTATGAEAWPLELADYRSVTPEALTGTLDLALAAAEAAIADAVAASGDPASTFDDVPGRIDRALTDLWNTAHGPSEIMVDLHPDEAVRTASQAARERVVTWRRSLPLRDDLGDAIDRYAASPDAAHLAGEERRVLDHWVQEVRRAGHGLAAGARAELRAMVARVVELEAAFQRNIAEWEDGIDVTPADLAGMPDTYIEALGPGSSPGTLRISLAYPEILPFLGSSSRRDLRETLMRKMDSRAMDANRVILEELLDLRRRQALLLGYPSWAHFRIEPKMAGTPERVAAFHETLFTPLHALAGPQFTAIADRLEADTGDRVIGDWDVRYYKQRILAEEHDVDQQLVADYLTLEAVLDGLLDLTARVFGLRYVEHTETRAWHTDVRLLEVLDAGGGERLGWCYLDLHPRPGKFSHGAADVLRFPLVTREGVRSPGVSVIMVNMPRSSATAPARLEHGDMIVLFHEFGHVLHGILGTTRYYGTAMYAVQEDFIEAVSQIMENWAWEPSILQAVSRHHQSGEPMPPDLAERLVAARTVNLGVDFLQWFGGYADFDLTVHGPEPVDLDEAVRHADSVRMRTSPEGTFWPASFGHIADIYDAGYYGYLWSLVYGDDLWSRFEAEGIDSPAVGAAFRREILEACAVRDANDLVESFLGRPSTSEAFLWRAGLEAG